MNGPFLSERAIVSPYSSATLRFYFSPYSSTRRSLIHCARRSLRNPRTGPGTRVKRAERHTNRVPWAFGVFSTATAHPGLHNRYCTCTGGAATNRQRVWLALPDAPGEPIARTRHAACCRTCSSASCCAHSFSLNAAAPG